MTIKMTKDGRAQNAGYIERLPDLRGLLQKKSHFLLGPRQTGKTSLIHHSLGGTKVYDLLDIYLYGPSPEPGSDRRRVGPRRPKGGHRRDSTAARAVQPLLLEEMKSLLLMEGVHAQKPLKRLVIIALCEAGKDVAK